MPPAAENPLSGFYHIEKFVNTIHQMIRMLLPEAWKDQSKGDCFIVEILMCNVLACWIKTVVWSYRKAQITIDQSMCGKLKTRQIRFQLDDRVVFQHFLSDRKRRIWEAHWGLLTCLQVKVQKDFRKRIWLPFRRRMFSALLFTKAVAPLPPKLQPYTMPRTKMTLNQTTVRNELRMIYRALILWQFIFHETPILLYFHVFNSLKLKVKTAYIHDKHLLFLNSKRFC